MDDAGAGDVSGRATRVHARLVVVSPHLDDAALSLGATIARAVRGGVAVDVLTVLAGDPWSTAPARGWDRRGGFETEGGAASARREEDRQACAILGAQTVWLPYGNADYERHGTDAEIAGAVAEAVGAADAVLLPGYPLRHSDHAWLSRLLVRELVRTAHVGLYVEEPYAWWDRAAGPVSTPDWLERSVAFSPVRAGMRDRVAKLRALRAYSTQLELLGLRRKLGADLYRLLWWEARTGGEAIAWLGTRSLLLPH